MEKSAILQGSREQRVTTLALAEQVAAERWREPLLPGERTLHEALSHLLAWDEWAIATFELSAIRALPQSLRQALDDVDAFNMRAVTRFHNLPREDLLNGLQTANTRLIASAQQSGGAAWSQRRLPDLARPAKTVKAADSADAPADPTADTTAEGAQVEQPPRAPSVGGIVRRLTEHERAHADEIARAFGITANLETFTTREAQPTPDATKK